MKLLAKNLRTGVSKTDGKPWEMTVCHVQTDKGDVFEIALFNVGSLPNVNAGDTVEALYELRKNFSNGKTSVSGQVIGFTKAKAA